MNIGFASKNFKEEISGLVLNQASCGAVEFNTLQGKQFLFKEHGSSHLHQGSILSFRYAIWL